MEVTLVAEEWTPPWAGPHISARYTALVRGEDNEVVEPQHITCSCAHCGGQFKRDCESGIARNHIQTFCRIHNQCPPPHGSPNT